MRVRSVKEGRMFFFEKKNQKTFIFDVACAAGVLVFELLGALRKKWKFLLLFSKEKTSSCLLCIHLKAQKAEICGGKPAAAAANRLKKGLLF